MNLDLSYSAHVKDLILKDVRNRILDLIKTRGLVSVDEATHELGLAKTTVREHLLLLENQRLILREYRSEGRGRPQLAYKLAPEADVLYPSQEPALLREMIRQLLDSGQEDWLKRFFKSYWNQRREKFGEKLKAFGKDDLASRLKVLEEMLLIEGFMPKIEKPRSGPLVVRECNCPFREAIKETDLPCLHEAKFIESALGLPTTRVSYIPDGSPNCTYEFEAKSKNA